MYYSSTLFLQLDQINIPSSEPFLSAVNQSLEKSMGLPQATSKRYSLQSALESRNWTAVDNIISSLPSRLPKTSDPATITAFLEEARAAADSLVQACDFGTAFESAFTTRKALIDIPSVLSWATESLEGFSCDERVIGRIATMLGLLGMGSDGRAAVGCSGAIDQLTVLWNTHSTSVDIARALVSLCSGHIDNVSRTMRRRGISVAVDVLSDHNNKQDAPLIEQTLLYIGLCVICTPDTAREERSVVPALIQVLEDDLNLRRPQLLRHVLMALGNIIDCWTKEGFGYDLGDQNRLVDSILKAWGSLRRSKDIATSSSWALGSMVVGDGAPREALHCRLGEVKSLAEPWKTESKTCAFLYETAEQVIQEQGAQGSDREDQMVKVAKSVDGSSRITCSSDEICEDSSIDSDKSLSITKKRGRGRPRRNKPFENRAEKTTGRVSSASESGNRCEADVIDGVSCDGEVSAPHAHSYSRKRQSKQTPKQFDDTSAKTSANNAPARRSKRRRTPSAKCLSPETEGRRSSSRRAWRLPVEVIVISSDSDDEPSRRSPKAVQDICT